MSMGDRRADKRANDPSLSLSHRLVSSVSYLHIPRSCVHPLGKESSRCEDGGRKFVIDILYFPLEAQDWQRDTEGSRLSC